MKSVENLEQNASQRKGRNKVQNFARIRVEQRLESSPLNDYSLGLFYLPTLKGEKNERSKSDYGQNCESL